MTSKLLAFASFVSLVMACSGGTVTPPAEDASTTPPTPPVKTGETPPEPLPVTDAGTDAIADATADAKSDAGDAGSSTFCEARMKCSKTAEQCKQELVCVGHMRSAASAGFQSCVTHGKSCNKIDECLSAAGTTVASEPAPTTLRTACLAKWNACGTATLGIPAEGCTTLGVFDDASLPALQACFAKASCDEAGNCILLELVKLGCGDT